LLTSGRKTDGSVVRNNIATDYDNADSGVTEDHNMEIAFADFSTHFIDAAANNLQLKATSAAIDAGSALLAPSTDALEVPRPLGSGVDIGAYEFSIGYVFTNSFEP
jgi:hypothetical protein